MTPVTLLIRPLMTEEEAVRWATPEELACVATFGTEQRRREFLSWRAVVREALGNDVMIAYNELGAPVLCGRAEHLSVSHAGDCVVVALADRPIGVDIERMDRNFERVKGKYLTANELAISCDSRFLAVAWCAKEAVYKRYGIRELTFEEVQLTNFTGDRIMACVRGGDPMELIVQYLDTEFVLVYCL